VDQIRRSEFKNLRILRFRLQSTNGAADPFTTTITVDHPWLTIRSATLTTGLYGSAMPGSRITSVGAYASPRGCQGAIGSTGVAMQDRIEADLSGSECAQPPDTSVFSGRLTLTRVP
jgi:hypothetical protein